MYYLTFAFSGVLCHFDCFRQQPTRMRFGLHTGPKRQRAVRKPVVLGAMEFLFARAYGKWAHDCPDVLHIGRRGTWCGTAVAIWQSTSFILARLPTRRECFLLFDTSQRPL